MTDKEIFKKAIEKVVINGWSHYYCYNKQGSNKTEIDHFLSIVFRYWDDCISINDIILSPEFAKAFWGEEKEFFIDVYANDPHDGVDIEKWKWHLREMVILPDNERLKYLANFLEVDNEKNTNN